jgi:hypothetical protein
MNYIKNFLKIDHKINEQTKKNIDQIAQNYQNAGKSREAAYAEAMHDSGVLDDDEYRKVMASIK